MPCMYCGDSLETKYNQDGFNGNFVYTGIDRVNNDEGYTKDNAIPCCSTCNYMKKNLSVTDFLNHVKKIFYHNSTEH